jgi:hypothetical protein
MDVGVEHQRAVVQSSGAIGNGGCREQQQGEGDYNRQAKPPAPPGLASICQVHLRIIMAALYGW